MDSALNLPNNEVKIVGARVWEVRIPVKRKFRISTGDVSKRPILVVELKIIYDGKKISGYGEVPAISEPVYNEESLPISMAFLKVHGLPTLVGRKLNLYELISLLKKFRGHNFAKFGIETAFLYALLSAENLELLDAFPKPRRVPVLQESIPLVNDKEEMKTILNKYVEARGIRNIKVKVCPRYDVNLLDQVCADYDFVSVDANASFNPLHNEEWQEILKICEAVDEVEQPFPPKNFYYHNKLADISGKIISLDESLVTLFDFLDAIEFFGKLAKKSLLFNLKPPRLGSLIETWRIMEDLAGKVRGFFIGGLLENFAKVWYYPLLTALPINFPSDYSPPFDFYADSLMETPHRIEEGHVVFDEEPSFKINVTKLKKYGRPLFEL